MPIPETPKLDDGFYEILRQGEGTRFPSTDGQNLLLGKSLGTQFGKATIRSRSQDNSAFSVTLKGAEKLWDGPEPLEMALVVNNVCMKLSGNSIPHADDTRDLYFTVMGETDARAAAKALKCDVELRKDPGHRLTVKWAPEKKSYQLGDTITLTMELRNAGKEPVTIRIGGRQRGPRDNQYRFVAQSMSGYGKCVPDTGDPVNFGGLVGATTLKPGEVYAAKVELDKWFKFEQAGTYRMTGIWELHLVDPALDWFDGVIWDDLVSGECFVKVVNANKK